MALSYDDASIVLGMIARGDSDQDIAAWFGIDQKHILEIKSGSYGDIPVAQAPKLPPKGSPGPKGQRLRACVAEALKALQHCGARSAAAATKDLEEGLMRYDAHEG